MTGVIEYLSRTHTAMVGNREFAVQNLIPIFVDDSRRKEVMHQIELELFDIFQKYVPRGED